MESYLKRHVFIYLNLLKLIIYFSKTNFICLEYKNHLNNT